MSGRGVFAVGFRTHSYSHAYPLPRLDMFILIPALGRFLGGLSNFQKYPLSIRVAFLDTWGCIAAPRHLPKHRFRCCGLGVCVLGLIPQG